MRESCNTNRSYLLWILLFFIFVVASINTILADSITPSSFTANLPVGGSTTINKTVTITKELPTTAKVDVFFLTDSTGSMWEVIDAVRTGASSILAATSGLGDVYYAVGEYRDWGDTFVYRLNTDLTNNTTSVQNAINNWHASGGGDWYEAQLFALKQLSENTSWRLGSKRILVWFGDAPGHDPSGGVTEAMATSALVNKNIKVEALDVGPAGWGLDREGQATRITSATGGHLYSGVNTGNIVQVIKDSIGESFKEYSKVSLAASGNTLVNVSISPTSYTGTFDRSIDRTFNFEVTFTCLGEGIDSFKIHALVDDAIMASEDDIINQGATPPIPEPSTIMLMVSGLLGLSAIGGKRIKKSC